MDLISYLRILRRRWVVLLLPALGATLIAWVTLPSTPTTTAPTATTYDATATLIKNPSISQEAAPLDLATVALFATVGDVPVRATKALGSSEEPQVLASLMTVTPVPDTGTLTITSKDSDPVQVVARVNAFADATVEYFKAQERDEAQSRIDAANRQLKSLTQQLRDTERRLTTKPTDTVAQSKQDSLKGQYSQTYGTIIQLNQALQTSGPLQVLQRGVAIPQATTGFTAPRNPLIRLGISALLGLLLGGAFALLIERVDSRLRTREQVEDSFGLPVLAEIPSLPLGQRGQRSIVSADMPASATAEAHRALRSAVLLLGPDGGHDVTGSRRGRALVVLVTSALPGEGKTTTVANLAAVLAEAGRRVLILSFDLRNPRIHEYFEVDNGVGISDLLAAESDLALEAAVQPTRLNGVELITSGQRLDQPGALLTSAGRLIDAARRRADVVLIDSAPMLSASDAVDLAQHVDVALMVSRLNRTTTTHAAATQRLLSRLGVPALGTVLVGSRPTGSQDGAYRATGTPTLADDRSETVVDAASDGSAPSIPAEAPAGTATTTRTSTDAGHDTRHGGPSDDVDGRPGEKPRGGTA